MLEGADDATVRRVHTAEFKAETVNLVKHGGRKVSELSRELGLADSLVRTWVRQADVDAGNGLAGLVSYVLDSDFVSVESHSGVE